MSSIDPTAPIQVLARVIESIGVAMLTTADGDGRLESHPMSAQEIDAQGALWFFAQRSLRLATTLDHHPQVNVAYIDPDEHRYVSMTGSAAMIDDQHKRHSVWRPVYRRWFPAGVDDPSLVLLRVQIDYADYWEAWSNRMVRFVDLGRAPIGDMHTRLAGAAR